MGRNLATTISKAAAVLVALAGSVLVAQAPVRREPPPPLAQRQSPPPSYSRPPSPHRPSAQRSARVDAVRSGQSGRKEDEARPLDGSGRRADGRADRVERRISERQEHWMRDRVRDRPVQPRRMSRLKTLPTHAYWHWRYSKFYRWATTQTGFIPVTAVPSSVSQLTDYAIKKTTGHPWNHAGWKGYGLVVPPGESVTFNLYHPNRPWLRLIICDKWGGAVPGGLGSLMPQPVPRLTYTNPGHATETIYLIVDDPGWMSHEYSPYTLEIARTWNPDLFPEDLGNIVRGIWGNDIAASANFRTF